MNKNKEKKKNLPIEYKVMDMLDMKEIEAGSFDYVIDKGSLDALCSDTSE